MASNRMQCPLEVGELTAVLTRPPPLPCRSQRAALALTTAWAWRSRTSGSSCSSTLQTKSGACWTWCPHSATGVEHIVDMRGGRACWTWCPHSAGVEHTMEMRGGKGMLDLVSTLCNRCGTYHENEGGHVGHGSVTLVWTRNGPYAAGWRAVANGGMLGTSSTPPTQTTQETGGVGTNVRCMFRLRTSEPATWLQTHQEPLVHAVAPSASPPVRSHTSFSHFSHRAGATLSARSRTLRATTKRWWATRPSRSVSWAQRCMKVWNECGQSAVSGRSRAWMSV
eukprot:358501-Chlamydomonas_euryale.AAC.1